MGDHVPREDIATDERRQVFQRAPTVGRRRRVNGTDDVVLQGLESLSVRETERSAFDIQAAAERERRRQTADRPRSDVLAVSVTHVFGRVQVRVQTAVLPRLERVAEVPERPVARVLRAHRFPGRVHQLRACQIAGRRPGPDPTTLREGVGDVVRAHGGRGEGRQHRTLQEAQVF